MKQDPVSFDLRPFDFSQILEEVPELKKFGYRIDTYSFDPVIDSSDVDIEFWKRLTRLIEDNYSKYDGFVILHGTDTMSFSASALSFMLGDIAKPVVFTGSQLPIGMLRTDGKENLISSIEIAASKDSCGRPMVPEVCIYFESQLYRQPHHQIHRRELPGLPVRQLPRTGRSRHTHQVQHRLHPLPGRLGTAAAPLIRPGSVRTYYKGNSRDEKRSSRLPCIHTRHQGHHTGNLRLRKRAFRQMVH